MRKTTSNKEKIII